jgi:tetratricopeptide (TPR) repeat protein
MTTCPNCGYQSSEEFRFCPECGTQQGGGSDDPLIGRTLGNRYRVLELVGSGAMGRVYRGEHVALKKPVALKVLRRDLQVSDEARHRFQREGIAAGKFTHPNAIQIFDFERTDDGLFYLAMEFVDGPSLKQWLQERGPLPAEEAVELVEQLLDTLAEAHRCGVIHRDLKPENLMLVEDVEGRRTLKVLDFGLSKLADRRAELSMQTVAGHVLGTPAYMAPEQWQGEDADARTDLYAASLVLFELLAGAAPYAGSDVTKLMVRVTQEPPPSLLETYPDVPLPVDLDEVLHRGLAKSRDERFQTAAEMLEALENVRFDRLARGSGKAGRGRSSVATPRAVSGGAQATQVSPTRSARRAGASARGGARRRRPAEASRPSGMSPAVLAGGGIVALLLALVGAWGLGLFGGGGTSRDAAPLVRSKPVESRTDAERSYLGLLDQARSELTLGDATQARRSVDAALAKECADAEGLLVRAAILRARGDDETARLDLEEALVQYPNYADAQAALGWLWFDRGDLDKARQRFAEAQKSGGAGRGVAGLAALDVVAGDARAAVERLETATTASDADARTFYWLGRARLALGEVEPAIEALQQAKRRDASFAAAYEGLGDAYLVDGRRDEAITQWTEGVEMVPGDVKMRRKLVELMLEDGRAAAARDMLAPARDSAPGDAGLMVLEGLVLERLGNNEGARRMLRRALDAGGLADRGRVAMLLGGLAAQAEQHEEAAEAFRTAAEAFEGGTPAGQALAYHGLALFRAGRYLDAVEPLERAVGFDPNQLIARYTLGVLYLDYVGDSAKARQQFDEYVARGGDNPRARELLRSLR